MRMELRMVRKNDVSGMALGSVLGKWMDEVGWKEEIEINDERSGARVSVTLDVNDQPHRLVLETDEQAQIFTLTLVSPFNVPPARMADMARILNRLNCGIRMGRLYCWDDDDANPVIFQQAIDMEGSKLVPKQIHNMMGAAINTFAQRGELLVAAALTKQPIDALWSEYVEQGEKQQEKSREEDGEEGPTEL
jgi:hypothetical protein